MSEGDRERRARAAMAEMERLVRSFVVLVRIAKIHGDRETKFNAASGTVVALNGRHHLLTAWHVYHHYTECKKSGTEAVVVVDDVPLVRPILTYKDKNRDIVMLELPKEVAGVIDAKVYYPGARWPPLAVAPGDVVLVSGYPRRQMRETDATIEARSYSFVHHVTSTSNGQFSLNFGEAEWVQLGDEHAQPPDAGIGSMSGGPVFLIDQVAPVLVGIVKEIGTNLPILHCASLDHMRPDL